MYFGRHLRWLKYAGRGMSLRVLVINIQVDKLQRPPNHLLHTSQATLETYRHFNLINYHPT
jgi:hypothetical protein